MLCIQAGAEKIEVTDTDLRRDEGSSVTSTEPPLNSQSVDDFEP